jgi:hypothetical protein
MLARPVCTVADVSFQAAMMKKIPVTWHPGYLKPFHQQNIKMSSKYQKSTYPISVICTPLAATSPASCAKRVTFQRTESSVTRGFMKTMKTLLLAR